MKYIVITAIIILIGLLGLNKWKKKYGPTNSGPTVRGPKAGKPGQTANEISKTASKADTAIGSGGKAAKSEGYNAKQKYSPAKRTAKGQAKRNP